MAGQDKWYFTKEQLLNSPSRKCGLDADKELAYRQQAANLIQDMGQRLHVSQLCINTAIVYMHRFYAFHSFTHFHRNAMAAAALFLAAKMEEQPRKLEYIIKIAHHCLHRDCMHSLDARSEYYQEQAQDLVFNENVLLQTLGFDVAIDHPHTHVVKTCSLIRASKDLAQTSYFMASNSLHLTTMCLQYKPTVVACFCIHLASKWSNWEIPQSNEGKHWFNYVDKSVTAELLEHLTSEFLHIFDRCPSRLKKKIMSMPNSQGSPSQLGGSSHNSGYVVASSPFDKEPRKIKAEPEDARKYSKPENDEFRKIKLENDDSRKYPKNESDEMRKNKQEMEDMRKNLKQEIEEKVELSKHQRGLFSPPTASSTVTKIDHREYRERQKRAAAALAASGGSSSSGGSNAMPPSTSGSLPRPPHNRWPHPPRDSEVKEREIANVPHPSLRDPNVNRESSRDSGMSMLREPTNVRDPNMRESMSSRDHNGMRETSREASNVRDMSGAYRDMSNPRERDSSNHREHIPQRDSLGQRDINSSHNLHVTSENLRSTADRNMNMGNLNRDPSVSGANVRDSNSLKESMARDNIRDHSNISGQSTGRDPSVSMREMPVMGQPGSSNRPVSGHSTSRESGANRLPSGPPANGGASLNQQQRSSHSSSTNSSRHIPSTQGIPQDSRQKSSQQNYPPRPPPVLPTPPAHPIPSQRPQSLFSPPEPQRKPSRPSQPSLMTIPREAFVPAPLSPFSSPNETEIKGPPEVVENIVTKKEEVVVVPPITQSAVPPPSLAESEISNNLETDPNLVSSLLKEAIPYRTEKKKKKEKHKHKDKKDKRDKHKKNKDKKRDSDEHSSGSNSINNTNPSTQPVVSNSNNLSIKITLPREAAANILPPGMPAAIGSNGGSTTGGHPVGSGNAISNNNTASLDDYTSPPARRLTIKIPREKIKLQPPSPPPQQTASSRQTQALKIKIPKELVERESRKRPMEQGGSREGPPTKASKNQPNMHHSSNKISHHAMGNGQSNYK